MTKYMAYLFAIVRKKWSTYLIPLFGALVLIAVLLAQILTNDTDNPVIGNVATFWFLPPFIFGGMFVGTKAINIFKEGEVDGTELLIVSKPISRGQIVIGKFVSLYILIFGYALWSFLTTMAVGFVDTNATVGEIMKFTGGYAIGSLIIMVIFSAVIIFFASVLGTIGTMSLSIVLPAILPILSFLLVPMGHGSLQDLGGQMDENRMLNTKIDNNGIVTIEDPQYMYDSDNSDYVSSLKEKQDGFYKYVAYGDVWQHMFGFYSILNPQSLNTNSQGVKVEKSKELLTDQKGFVLIDDESNLKYLYISDASDRDAASKESKMTQFFKLLKDNSIELNSSDSGKDFYDLRDLLKNEIASIDANNNNSELQNKINDILGTDNQDSSFRLAVAYFASKNNIKIKDLTSSYDNLHSLDITISKNQKEVFTYNNLLSENDKLKFIDQLKFDRIEIDSQPNDYDEANMEIKSKLDLTQSDYDDFVNEYGKDSLYEFATVYLSNAKQFYISDIDTVLGDKVSLFDGNYSTEVDVLTIKKYLDNSVVIAVYSIIAIIISGLVIFRYYRRDFK